MTLRRSDLELLLALADDGSLSAAARRMHVAQPALSRRLVGLERRLGGRLMDRSARGTVPTPAGRVLVDHARALLDGLDRAERDTVDALAGRRGRARLGTTPTLGADLLAPLLERLRATTPHVGVDLRTSGDSPRLRADVADGRLDAALCVLGRRPDRGTAVALRGQQRFALAVPTTHPLAAGTTVARRDLVDVPFVALPPGEGLRVLLDGVFAQMDARPRVEVQVEERQLLLPLVAAGVGVALVPEGFAQHRADPGVAVTALDPPVERDVGLVVPAGADLPALGAELVAAVRAVTGWT